MKRISYIWLFILISVSGFSQLTNSWIDYNNRFYKINISQEGIYRIDYSTLIAAGIPVNTIRRQDFQIFTRGEEQYIHVQGAGPASNVFSSSDYIEFYASKNTGWLDTVHYANSSWHTNPNISLYTDTAIYFLSWDINTTNRRLTPENNTNYSGKSSESYFMYESRKDYYTTSFEGQYILAAGLALYDTEFTEGQSWSGPPFGPSENLKIFSGSVPTSNAYSGGQAATATAALIGANLQNHAVIVTVASSNVTVNYNAVKVNQLSYSINAGDLGNTTTTFTFKPLGPIDRNTVAYISIKYPHTLNMSNSSSMALSILDATSSDTAYLNVTNFNNQGQTSWLYDLTNNRRIVVTDNGSTNQMLVPNSGGEKTCYLFTESAITSVSSLQTVGLSGDGKFTDYSSMPHDSAYIIVYNKKLRDDGNGNDFVTDYIVYRTSHIYGGMHDVIPADIDELYDQFAFGIRKHPMAIRGFAEYTLSSPSWPTKPQNLLLIGKGVSYNSSRSTSNYYDNILIPTVGWPSSDILLTSGLDGSPLAPGIPTGRIAATTGTEIGEYLNKVKEFDANQVVNIPNQLIETQEWKKQVLHFAGGTGQEHMSFRGYLKGYEDIIEDTLYGGRIHQFNKNSSDPIQITTSDSIENLINTGVSLMTFFGHASGSGFDQNIDNPGVYQNIDGKYPLLIANACLVGDIHQPQSNSNSEAWVLHERGTIGFLASVAFGEPYPLSIYTRELYANIGQKMYGQSIGAAVQQTIKNIEFQSGLRRTCQEMTLHGDPAIVLNTHKRPDYAIRIKDVYTTPKLVNSETDSFDLNIIVTNIGRAIKKDIGIKITRQFPVDAGAASTFTVISASNIFYKDTFTVKLPVDLINGMGLNHFEIRVDDMEIVEELSETNNNILFPLLIQTDDIIPIYPYKYAVVPDKMQSLRASTGNPFAEAAVYRFQIDTSDGFSPPLLEYTVSHAGGVVEWIPSPGSALEGLFSNSSLEDSTVFFWRVRRDSVNPQDLNHIWRESSFQYIQNKRGWGQAHFHQFKNDDYNLIDYQKPNRRFEFVNTPKNISCQVVGSANNTDDWLSTEYRINGSLQMASSCGVYPAVLVTVIDPITLLPWAPDPNGCGSGTDHKARIFHISSVTNQLALASYLLSIPNDYYVLAYSFIGGLPQTWDGALISTFQTLGWDSILSPAVSNYTPFIYFMKIGDLSSMKESIGATTTSTITLSADLTTNNDFGYLTTKYIGPAQDWGSLHWDVGDLEASDSVRLEVSGVNSLGNIEIIPALSSLLPDSADIYNLNTLISPSTYSSIQLRAYKADSLKTAAQLKSWHVLFDDVPESALNPSIQLSFYNDTVDEGEIISFSVAVQNVSEYDMDSLLISFWILDRNRNVRSLPSIRYKPLLQYPDTILTGLTFSTKDFAGVNSLWVEVNPYNSTKNGYDQLEKYHFNNIAEYPFYVASDKMNPLVDVTFDGTHILDGDIVSAEPHIIIELKDENKYLVLDNDSMMRIYLTDEGQLVGQPIPYDGNTLRFIPASLPDNRARVEFNPGLLEDGIYELKVQAKDASRNESGDLDYLISFEVINKPSVTSVMNWPNPFSTSTRFVFTLTGSETPQDFRIRILTISGRIVREIFADELGPLHIGKNITEYAWDGRDEYGDQLANGVYLYKVDIQLNDETMELRETKGDQYFHKGYGKMYLLK